MTAPCSMNVNISNRQSAGNVSLVALLYAVEALGNHIAALVFKSMLVCGECVKPSDSSLLDRRKCQHRWSAGNTSLFTLLYAVLPFGEFIVALICENVCACV